MSDTPKQWTEEYPGISVTWERCAAGARVLELDILEYEAFCLLHKDRISELIIENWTPEWENEG